jgi:hypothetical protein
MFATNKNARMPHNTAAVLATNAHSSMLAHIAQRAANLSACRKTLAKCVLAAWQSTHNLKCSELTKGRCD